jgi:DNA-binding LytR/AlgR family response regulator
MINCIIVDDEPLALDVLETYVERVPNLHLVQRCNNAFEAFEAIKQHKIDLVFLDIQMPQVTGIDFIKSLTQAPRVIFTTAYPNYAIEGFDLDAVDYLLKPIAFDRFLKAVNKASAAIEKVQQSSEDTDKTDEPKEEEAPNFIFVKSDKKLIKIKYEDIIFIEGLKDYVIIRINTGRVITLQTMKSLEEKLPSDQFRRIHRSYIVRLDRVDAVIGSQVEIDKKQLPIGKNYRDELLEVIHKYKL